MIDWNIVGIGISFIVGLLAISRWLFGQFASLKTFVSDQSDKILNKLEYHERHDDTRFSDVAERFTDLRNNIWELRVQAAANATNQKINGVKP